MNTQQSTVEERLHVFCSKFLLKNQILNSELQSRYKISIDTYIPKVIVLDFIKSELQLAEQKAREEERERIKDKIGNIFNCLSDIDEYTNNMAKGQDKRKEKKKPKKKPC